MLIPVVYACLIVVPVETFDAVTAQLLFVEYQTLSVPASAIFSVDLIEIIPIETILPNQTLLPE